MPWTDGHESRTSPPATGSLVTNGSRATNRVALALDMGGRVGDALAIMTWLRDHGVPATIFLTGEMADSTATDAGRRVLARIDALPDLFDLGNPAGVGKNSTDDRNTSHCMDVDASGQCAGRSRTLRRNHGQPQPGRPR